MRPGKSHKVVYTGPMGTWWMEGSVAVMMVLVTCLTYPCFFTFYMVTGVTDTDGNLLRKAET